MAHGVACGLMTVSLACLIENQTGHVTGATFTQASGPDAYMSGSGQPEMKVVLHLLVNSLIGF